MSTWYWMKEARGKALESLPAVSESHRRQGVAGQSLHGCLERVRGSEMPLREAVKGMLHTGSRISLREGHPSQAAERRGKAILVL